VVIPTRDGGPRLREVLEALRGQDTRRVVEVVAVDSGSRDDTVSTLRAGGARVLSVPAPSFDHGLTRNEGIAAARGALVVLLTQDAVPAGAGWLEALLAPLQDPAVAGVYARQVPRPEATALTARNVAAWLAGVDEGRVQSLAAAGSWEALAPLSRYHLCCFDHVCAALRRAAWERFPYRAAPFAEDLEWGREVIRAGFSLVYEPRAVVLHSHDRSLAYEYRRTYACHRRLYALFGLRTVPRARDVLRNTLRAGLGDALYAWRHERGLPRRLRALVRAPAAALLSNLAQWRGARDEIGGAPAPGAV
jgi:rhamnosyltransferase